MNRLICKDRRPYSASIDQYLRRTGRWRSAGKLLSLAGVCFALLVIGATALAQLDTGAVTGTVFDPDGRVVQKAQVDLQEEGTGTRYSTVSSSSGYYVVPAVRPGTYDVTASAAGFKTVIYRGVVVAVGAQTARNLTLQIGSTSATVTVKSGPETLEAETSEVDDNIEPVQVEDLPLAVSGTLRSLSSLEFLVPGAIGIGENGVAGVQLSKIDGGQEEATDYLVDGITTNRQQNGSGNFDIIAPSIEAVNEFHVSISGLPAQMGQTTGGIANFNSKSGTNSYHGTVYDFFKNAALDANSWFNNGDISLEGNTPAAIAEYRRPADTKNDYGVAMGGPVRIPHVYNGTNRTFFYFSWEQLRYSYGGAINSLLPTPAELGANGQNFDFSSTLGSTPLGVSPCGETVYPGEIFDPNYENTSIPCRYAGFGQSVSGTQGAYSVSGAPTNRIPLARASKVAMNIVNTYLMPLAKQEVAGSSNYNYTYNSIGLVNQTVYSLRIDQNVGSRHKIWGFWSSRENTDSGGNSNMPPPIQTCCGTVNQLGKLFRAGWDWVLTPTVVNTLTVGGNRSNNINKSKAALMNTDWDQQLGIANGFSNDFPVFAFYGNTFGGIGQQLDSTDTDNVLAVNDILHWQHGEHSFIFGGEYQYHQYSWQSHIGGTCSGNAGCLQFWDNQTASDEDFWGEDGNSLAAFLIGEAGDLNNLNNLHQPRWIMHDVALFTQDDWKLTPSLTLNLGFRWSFSTPRYEADGDTTILDPTLPDPAASDYPGALVFAGKGAGRNGNVHETWAQTYYKDFSPRVGLAWQPGFPVLRKKLVVRANGGIYYGPLIYADFGQGTTQGFQVQGNLFTADPLDGPPLDGGLQALATTPDLNPSQLDGTTTSVDYIAPNNGRPAMVETWTLETQYAIKPDWIFTLGYLGMHSTHLHALLDLYNDMPDKDMALGDWLYWWATLPGPAGSPPLEPYANFACASGCTWPVNEHEYQALRPFPQITYVNMDSYLQNLGMSSYDALEAKLQHNFSNGFNLLVSYTFSKDLTDADAAQPYVGNLQQSGGGSIGVQDPENLRAEKCVSSEDAPNNLVVSYIYDLPFGQGKRFFSSVNRPIRAVISNWSVSGIQRYLSGQPISIWGATGIPGKNSSVRFDQVPGQPVKNPHYKNPLLFNPNSNATACATGYFNCAAFYDPNLYTNRDPNGVGPTGEGNPWRFGTMPRNSANIRGPAYLDEDFGISKLIPIHGSITADFRAEMFDAFNRHIFVRPNSDLNSANLNVGQIGGLLNGPRNVQLRLRIAF